MDSSKPVGNDMISWQNHYVQEDIHIQQLIIPSSSRKMVPPLSLLQFMLMM